MFSCARMKRGFRVESSHQAQTFSGRPFCRPLFRTGPAARMLLCGGWGVPVFGTRDELLLGPMIAG